MNNMNLDIMGISETRWTESGKVTTSNHTMIYSGGIEHKNGVGFILNKKVANAVMGYWPISERVLMVKFFGRPLTINVVQECAPTQGHSDTEIEEFYEEIEKALKYAKSDDVLCVMEHLTAKVGSELFVGKYGLGEKNDRGGRSIEFYQQNNSTIANTLFQHPNRKLDIWNSPGDILRNQIDYMMVNQRFRNSIKNAKTFAEAKINSDHNPGFIKKQVKLKRAQAAPK